MTGRTIVLGTRASELARWQSGWIANELRAAVPELHVETVVLKTTGDKILDSPLSKIGDKGLFTKEIEAALLDGSIDLAVHSLKDLPTVLPEGLVIGAVTKRHDVRDVFIAHPRKAHKGLLALPAGATIATGSLRRKSQLLHSRPDFRIVDLRGNLGTRREKLESSDWDGMILAKAGVERLGWESIITEVLSLDIILPAVGQGALAVEIRADNEEVASLVRPLNHKPTHVATASERALLRRLEGGCQIPIGTYGRVEDGVYKLDAMVGNLSGTSIVRGTIEGAQRECESLGVKLAEQLIKEGAGTILEEIRNAGRGASLAGANVAV